MEQTANIQNSGIYQICRKSKFAEAPKVPKIAEATICAEFAENLPNLPKTYF